MDWHELRHCCATHLVTELGLTFYDAAEQLGHTDGGALLAKLYFHADKERALDNIAPCFRARASEAVQSQGSPQGKRAGLSSRKSRPAFPVPEPSWPQAPGPSRVACVRMARE